MLTLMWFAMKLSKTVEKHCFSRPKTAKNAHYDICTKVSEGLRQGLKRVAPGRSAAEAGTTSEKPGAHCWASRGKWTLKGGRPKN